MTSSLFIRFSLHCSTTETAGQAIIILPLTKHSYHYPRPYCRRQGLVYDIQARIDFNVNQTIHDNNQTTKAINHQEVQLHLRLSAFGPAFHYRDMTTKSFVAILIENKPKPNFHNQHFVCNVPV